MPHGLLLDEVRLRQVLFNVVGNAIKFTEKGQVIIRALAETEPGEEHANLLLEVEDTGIGIPKDQQETIFGAFAQVSGQSTRKFGGTGLGLAITKRLTEMMQGEITVRSEPGKGSTFRFVFPHVAIVDLGDPNRMSAGDDAGFSQFAPATILAADDVVLNRALLAGYFEGTAHKLITATNGREALEQAEKHRPDIILMDMRMPELDGYQTTTLLKANAALKHIPIIAVTASSFREEEARARKVCDGFIRKPFNRAELVAELRRFLKLVSPSTPSLVPRFESTPPVSPSAAALAKRPAVLVKLREEEQTVWPALCQRMEIGEIEAFALRLNGWAEEGEFPELQKYATALAEQVQAFDVDRLPQTLQSFPSICRSLKTSPPSGL